MRVRNSEHAEDLVQETLLAALQARNSFSAQSSEKTWLVGILKHKIIDHFRKYSRETVLDPFGGGDDDVINRFFDESHFWKKGMAPADWPNPTQELENQEFIEVFSNCLAEMPERTAMVFTMREMDELPSEEVCGILGITQNNFWVIMHRARLMLRRCLELKWFKHHK